MTVVRNTLRDSAGGPVVGAVVQAALVGSGFLLDGSAEVVRSVSTASGSDGSWSLDLTPQSGLEGSSYYVVREDGRVYTVTVPDAGPADLRDCLVDPPAVGLQLVGLSQSVADTLYASSSDLAGKASTESWLGLTDRLTVADWEATRGPAPYYIGHRGGGDLAPEHSLAAYEGAYLSGAQAIEVSVTRTADGQLVCMHDLTFDRTTVLSGTIAQTPATALRAATLRTDYVGPAWTTRPEYPPAFEEVLRRLGGRAVLICEAKDNSAYPQMIALIERYGLHDSVIVKAFYTSSRLAQAKAAGFRTFGYFGGTADVTTGNIATLVAANPDYVVIPTYDDTAPLFAQQVLLPDALVNQVVATGIPTWCYYTRRRADVAHMLSRGVVGFVTSGYPYVSRATAMLTRDVWASQAVSPGELVLDPTPSSTYALQWPGSGALRLARSSSNGRQAVMLGYLCPLANAAGTYSIDVDFRWPTLPLDTTQNISVTFGRADDRYYEHQAGIGTGYHAIIRGSGLVQLFTHTDGSTAGTQIGTVGVAMTAPPVAGTWYHAKVTVTPTAVTWTVNDGVDHVVTAADNTRRGGYVHLGKSGDATGIAEFRNLAIS